MGAHPGSDSEALGSSYSRANTRTDSEPNSGTHARTDGSSHHVADVCAYAKSYAGPYTRVCSNPRGHGGCQHVPVQCSSGQSGFQHW